MSKHIPGPWKFKLKNAGNGFIVSTQDENGGLICDVFMTNHPGIAEYRARLIAAAPELLAELKHARKIYAVIAARETAQITKQVLARVDALIAKVEGGS